MGLAKDLLEHFEHTVEEIALVPSDGGRFEVTVNGALIFSKLSLQRHAQAGEVIALVKKQLER